MPTNTFDEQFKKQREALRAKAAQTPKPSVTPAPGAPPRAPVAPPRPTIVTTSLGAAGSPGAAPDLTTTRGATSFERPQAPVAPEKAGLRSRFERAKAAARGAFSRGAGTPPPPAGSVPATPAAPAPGDRPSLRQRAQKGFAPALAAVGVGRTIAQQRDPDSTDRFAKRFGVTPPTGDLSIGDILKFAALRAGGAASDFGANIAGTASQFVGGPEDIVSRFFRDNEAPTAVAEPISTQTALDATGRTPPVGARPEETPPAVQTTDQGLRRNQVRQIGPSSFTNVPDEQATVDLGKKGGGLSVIGGGPEQLASEARAAKQFALNERVRRAGPGVTEEDLLEGDARAAKRRERDSEIFQLTQSGLSQDEAARRIFARDAKLAEAQAEAQAKDAGSASLSDQIAFLSLQQRKAAEEARSGLRQEQLGLNKEQLALNQEQVKGQQSAAGQRAVQTTIDQLNDPDPGTREAALDNVFESAAKDPNSIQGQLAFGEITKIIRANAGKERGVLDEGLALLPEALGGGPQPNFNAVENGTFTLETGFVGEGLSGTKIKDENGVDIGNLQDYPASAQEFIKKIFRAKQELQQGLRR